MSEDDQLYEKKIDELLETYDTNYCTAEVAAVNFLCNDIGQEHMPVVNVHTLRNLQKGDIWMLLHRWKKTSSDSLENALFLIVLTDHVTCAARNTQFFDIFCSKKAVSVGIPALLDCINNQWTTLFRNPKLTEEMSSNQFSNLMSLLTKAVNRLEHKRHRDCMQKSLERGQTILKNIKMGYWNQHSRTKPGVDSFFNISFPYRRNGQDSTHTTQHKMLSLNNIPTCNLKDSAPMQKDSILNTNITHKPALSRVPKKKRKYNILTYLSPKSSVVKKDTVINVEPVAEQKILETTSKENVTSVNVDTRSITPPFSTLPVESTEELITPTDKCVADVNVSSSPVKKPPSIAECWSPAASNKKNAFDLMMQRSKENSKRKTLFPPVSLGKV